VLRFDRYIGKNIFTTTLFAVAILSGVFMLGNIFKEARPLFVGKHPSPMLVFEFILSVLPFSLMFTIPFSFLAAIMLVFGRLSADNEILSMRMSGQSLPRIALPVFVVAAILSGFCFWLNVEVAPQAKARVKNLLFEAVKEDPNKFLDPGVVQTQLKDKRIYVRDRKGNTLYGLHIHDVGAVDKNFASNFYIYAESALIYVDMESSQIKLKLENSFALMNDTNGTKIPVTVEDVDPVLFSFDNKKKRRIKASSMTNNEIRTYLATDPEISRKDRAKLSNAVTSRQSFSFACLAFAIIGVPLGIGARRKETSTGFILSMAIGMGYFLFHIFAGQIKDETSNVSTILFWLPNVLALIIGLWLFRRARSK
jgi:lipopolysaccharide export LptBFGC system permease protein LptF